MTIRVLATIFFWANILNQPTCKRGHVWKKPETGVLKINVDASFYADNFTGASGVIKRDDRGKFLRAITHLIPHVASVESTILWQLSCVG